jgi:hypothetical protein
MSYFGLLVDGAEDVEQTGLAAARIAEDDDELSLPDTDGDSSKGSDAFEAEEIGLMQVFACDDADLVLEGLIFDLSSPLHSIL